MLIYGVHAVLEALKLGPSRVAGVIVSERAGSRARAVADAAGRAGVPVRRVTVDELDRMARGGAHQGVAANVAGARGVRLEDLTDTGGATPLLVVLDGVEDPRNVGAILRTMDAAGATGLVRQSRHAAPLDGAAAKASAGAVAHVPVADVVNVARALETLKAAGIWTVGLSGNAPTRYDAVDLAAPTALVLGAEESGLRRLVRERCDWVVSIPMQGHVESLNVSVAAGIVLFEALRQRRMRSGAAGGGPPIVQAPGRPGAPEAS